MKLIKQNTEYLPQENSLDGVYKQIERCARISYKSESRIVENSAKEFVDRLISSHHYAPLEFGTVYLTVPSFAAANFYKYAHNPYSKFIDIPVDNLIYITTNYRVLVENDWLDDLNYISLPMAHQQRYTFKVITSRGISQEILRHRRMSFIQESQRYCNYSKDKFDNQVTFIIPSFLEKQLPESEWNYNDVQNWYLNNMNSDPRVDLFLDACCCSETTYFNLLKEDCKPEEAREVLTNATKTEMCICGYKEDWEYFFNLRLKGTTGKPHPAMKELADLIYKEYCIKLIEQS